MCHNHTYPLATSAHTAPADYTGTTQILTFTPTVTQTTVRVSIINDSIVENDETFTGLLTIGNPDDAFLVPDVATVTISGEDASDSK